jgi:UDP-N-acetylmuramate dehydrogenase
METLQDQALAEHTTMRVGGRAADFVTAETRDELIEASLEAWGSGAPTFHLGGGSNVVFGDEGFDGTIIKVASRGIERLPDATTRSIPTIAVSETERLQALSRSLRAPQQRESVRIRVQAGEPWDDLVAYTVEQGWSGIEALSGVPGSTGAAPIQNIGAYGQELAACLSAVDFLDAATGVVMRMPASALRLGYRTSVFKAGLAGAVLSVDLVLSKVNGAAPNTATALSAPIAYAQVAEAVGVPVGTRVPIQLLRETVLALRSGKGMVLDPRDPESVSCGSFFTNPIVTESFARTLPSAAPRWPTAADEPDIIVPLGASIPVRAARDGSPRTKLSAAWLIEHAGIRRGFRLPGSRAHISTKHTLAIVNGGGATAEDVLELARYVRNLVQIEFGVLLAPEPILVGAEL